MRIDTDTQLCAVIGDPVEHSLSPAMHNAAFAEAGLNGVYLAFHVKDVAGALAGMRALPNFRGMSVTIPHKLAVMAHLDAIDPLAQRVGSVNTITNEAGRLVGSTTDGPGTVRAFSDAGVDLRERRVLFTGTGGAVRAVAFAFAEVEGLAGITLCGRTPAKVDALAADLRTHTAVPVSGAGLGDDLCDALDTHDVVIQGTPVGMYPNAGTSIIPAERLRRDHVVFDMVYRPRRTRLIEDAEALGCVVIHGLEMLANQAELQFERWTGVPAPKGVMRAALVAALEAH